MRTDRRVYKPDDHVLVMPGLVRVASVDELTCTKCGETSANTYCHRCGGVNTGNHTGEEIRPKTRMVRTTSYLHEHEYYIG